MGAAIISGTKVAGGESHATFESVKTAFRRCRLITV
jgi:hypothetical protein